MSFNANEVFISMANNGVRLQKSLHELAKSPYQTKQLDPMGIEKAAKLAGCSTNSIRNLEKRGDIAPTVEATKGTNFKRRLYTLEDVNNIRRLTGKMPERPEGSEAVIVTFNNLKGGVGKTSTSVHFAQYCAREGYKVLLVDMDPQASATSVFGYVPDLDLTADDTILDAITEDPSKIADIVKKTYWDQLDLIPSQLDLQNVDYILPSQAQEQSGLDHVFLRLRNALDLIKPYYDIIVIDTPPALGMSSINCMLAADYLIIPMTPYMYDIASSVAYFRILNDVVEFGIDDHGNTIFNFNVKKLNILISRHDGSHDSNSATRMITGAYGELVLNSYMMQTAEMQKSSSDMLSIYEQSSPRGSRETYKRAVMLLDAVNNEILDNIKEIWSDQASLADEEVAENG